MPVKNLYKIWYPWGAYLSPYFHAINVYMVGRRAWGFRSLCSFFRLGWGTPAAYITDECQPLIYGLSAVDAAFRLAEMNDEFLVCLVALQVNLLNGKVNDCGPKDAPFVCPPTGELALEQLSYGQVRNNGRRSRPLSPGVCVGLDHMTWRSLPLCPAPGRTALERKCTGMKCSTAPGCRQKRWAYGCVGMAHVKWHLRPWLTGRCPWMPPLWLCMWHAVTWGKGGTCSCVSAHP